MNRTDCPYMDCTKESIAGDAALCPECEGWLKRCAKCRTPNRSFANNCRFCGEKLPQLNEYWPGARGSGQRLGLNRFTIAKSPQELEIKEQGSFSINGRCRSLTAEDGYLIAVSDNGIIQAADLNRNGNEPCTFNAGGKIFAEPAVHNGTLYVGIVKDENMEKGGICAFTLDGLRANSPDMNHWWEVELKGTPVQALLPFENRLYLNVGFKDGRREIQVIENIDKSNPSEAAVVYKGEGSSMLVANPPTKKVFFLSKSGDKLYVNVFDHSTAPSPAMDTHYLNGAPSDFLEHIPIAAMGAKLFVVFGDKKELCRLDAHSNSFDIKITDRVRSFALSGMNRQVTVNVTGVYSTVGNVQEDLTRGEGIVSGPVIIRENLVAVGMRDGKIRIYQMNNPAVHVDVQAFNSNCKVSALASFKNMIAAGSQEGDVKLLRLT